MEKKIEGKITISRPTFGDGSESIVIRLTDKNALVQFAEVNISPRDFAMALTGLSELPVEIEANHLEKVGKVREREIRQAVCPRHYRKDELSDWLLTNAQEDGWILDAGLRSQGSVLNNQDGSVTLNYSVTRWVDAEDGQ